MRTENNSSVVVVAKVDRIRQIVAETIARTESVAVEMAANNLVVSEEKIVSKENVAAVEKSVDN